MRELVANCLITRWLGLGAGNYRVVSVGVGRSAPGRDGATSLASDRIRGHAEGRSSGQAEGHRQGEAHPQIEQGQRRTEDRWPVQGRAVREIRGCLPRNPGRGGRGAGAPGAATQA